MTPLLRAWLAVLFGFAAATVVYAAATEHRPQPGPFVVVVAQTDPAVQLFRHDPTGLCFLSSSAGGLLEVDRALCQVPAGIRPPILIPIPIPPGESRPPVSPER